MLWIILSVAAAIVVCGLLGVISMNRRPSQTIAEAPPAATIATTPALPSEQQVRQWITDQGWDGDYYQHVTAITWRDGVLVLSTDLYADSDARTPALWLCNLGGLYLADAGRPPRVQVRDGAEQVLTSRHGESDRCAWRR